MTWFSGETASHDSNFRCKRKLHGYLFLACALLLIAVPVNARPKETTGDVIIPSDDAGLPLSEEYGDVDNIEFHQAKIIDGVLHEEHPVIMYKEDFVSEDFVPKKNNTHRLRKHKDPAHRRRRINDQSDSNSEQYHPLQPEKIYFDILSSAPIVTSDESKAANTKTHVEVISLADADTDADDDAKLVEGEDEAKRVLNKRPKKFHHRRQRRDADFIWHRENLPQKSYQNPYYRIRGANVISAHPLNYYLPSNKPVKSYHKYPIPGTYHNGPVSIIPETKLTIGTRFGGEDNTDRVIWRDYTQTRNPNQRLNITVGTPRPLFGARTTTVAPKSAVPQRQQGGASFDSRPISNPFVTENPIFKVPTPPTPTSAPSSTSCVWAIASCCAANDSTVRYGCFQRYGCNLVFWNLNPCADNIRDNVIDYLGKQFD